MIQLFLQSLYDFTQYDFLILGLFVTILLSMSFGLISPILIAQKNAFMGPAISHSTLLGMSIASVFFKLDQTWPIFFTTLSITLLCTFFLAYAARKSRVPTDTIIGIFYTSTMALGLVIHSLYSNNKSDLLSFLFGNVLLITKSDVYLSLILFIITVFIILKYLNQWIYYTFDRDGAESAGINTRLFHYTFYFLLTFVIVTAIKIAGTLMIETLLLIPGFVALKWGKKLNGVKRIFIFSIIFSIIFSTLGLWLSNLFGTPIGAMLSLSLFFGMLVVISFYFFVGYLNGTRKQ